MTTNLFYRTFNTRKALNSLAALTSNLLNNLSKSSAIGQIRWIWLIFASVMDKQAV